jgi:hypothetical protein
MSDIMDRARDELVEFVRELIIGEGFTESVEELDKTVARLDEKLVAFEKCLACLDERLNAFEKRLDLYWYGIMKRGSE